MTHEIEHLFISLGLLWNSCISLTPIIHWISCNYLIYLWNLFVCVCVCVCVGVCVYQCLFAISIISFSCYKYFLLFLVYFLTLWLDRNPSFWCSWILIFALDLVLWVTFEIKLLTAWWSSPTIIPFFILGKFCMFQSMCVSLVWYSIEKKYGNEITSQIAKSFNN